MFVELDTRRGGGLTERLAFEASQSALDREERAAKTYAGPMRRVRRLTETGLAHQLALIQAPPGTC